MTIIFITRETIGLENIVYEIHEILERNLCLWLSFIELVFNKGVLFFSRKIILKEREVEMRTMKVQVRILFNFYICVVIDVCALGSCIRGQTGVRSHLLSF